MLLIQIAIISSIFAFNYCDAADNDNVEITINVHRVSPEFIEFQFDRDQRINPISLASNEMNFRLEHDGKMIKFRNTKPMQRQNRNQKLSLTLGYRDIDNEETKTKSFQCEVRNAPDEVIALKIEIPKLVSKLSQDEDSPAYDDEPNTEFPTSNDGADTPRLHTNHNDIKIDFSELSTECDAEDNFNDELLNTALMYSNIGTNLLVKQFKATTTNPVDAIRNIIVNKLELYDVEYKILQAKFIDEGLVFEMATPKDALKILAKVEFLKKNGEKNLLIEATTRSIFEPLIDIRMGELVN